MDRQDTRPTMPLVHLLVVFRPGSGDWSWQEELDQLRGTAKFVQLVEQISVDGILEPVLLGSDGRIWDGHHRICVAVELGLAGVPFEWAGDGTSRTTHDARVAAQALLDVADADWPWPVLSPVSPKVMRDWLIAHAARLRERRTEVNLAAWGPALGGPHTRPSPCVITTSEADATVRHG